MSSIHFAKTRSVKTPERGTNGSAGLDFFVPDDFYAALISPGQSVVIPSGIKVKFTPGHALIAFNKSGVAVKKGLQIGACVVDEDYQGEIHLHLTNISYTGCTIFPGEKIAQFILIPIQYPKLIECELDDLYDTSTERGDGKFGSTNNQ